MMILLNVVGGQKNADGKLIGASITGSADGKTFGVKYTEEKYKKMEALANKANEAESMEDLQNVLADFAPLMKDGYKELVETACPNVLVNEELGQFFLKTTNNVTISSKPLPQALVDRILISVEKGIDFIPLIKFWTRFLRNPNYSEVKADRLARYINYQMVDTELRARLIEEEGMSYDTATERATVYQTPITQEGLLVTYKYSKEIFHKFDQEGKQVDRYKKVYDEDDGTVASDGAPDAVEDRLFEPACVGQSYDPFFSYTLADAQKKGAAKHFIRVGRIQELESWDQVNCNDNSVGVKGLHVGNRDYVEGFGGQGRVLHDVFIDPMDIGAITHDGSGALRVRKYYVYKSNAGINRGIYHSSKFAAQNDLEWDDMRKKAIEESNKKLEKAEAIAAETAAI